MRTLDITKLDLVEGGNVIKQGHYFSQAYRPRDAKGEPVDLTGLSIDVVIFGKQGVIYETTATFVDGLIRYQVTGNIGNGTMWVEFTVTDANDATYREKFPANETDAKLKVVKSADDIDFVGVRSTTVQQLRGEQQALQQAYEVEVDGKIETFIVESDELKAEFNAAMGALTQDSEVVAARVGYNSLGEKLDGFTTQLAEKVGQGVKAEPEDLSDRSIALVTGNGTVNVLSEPREYSVTPTKTTFLELGTNLFNKGDLLIGKSVNKTTGEPVDNATWSLTKFMPANAGETYITNYQPQYVFFDGEYNFNSYFLGNANVPTTVPNNVKYMRVALPTSTINQAQINKGNTLLPYEAYKIKSKGLEVQGKDVKNLSISKEQLDFTSEYASTNLLDKLNVAAGKAISSTNGAVVDSVSFSLSVYIPGKPNTKYIANEQTRYGFYRSDYSFISAPLVNGGVSVTSPAETAYIRAAVPSTKLDTIQVNESSELLPYEPYAFYLRGSRLNQVNKNELTFEQIDKFVVEKIPDKAYTAPTIPAVPDLASWNSQQMLTLYEQLQAAYPHYITKTVLGQDGLGENIYRYDFKPKTIDLQEITVKHPKMILIAGMHGSEKAGVYTLYQTMKQICEAWETDENLEVLRWNVHFIVVPIVNLYSFDGNALRKNENDVDLSRNFSSGWTYNPDTSAPTYGGVAPLTEPGAILVDKLLKENKDSIYFASFHNFSNPPNQNYFVWNPGATALQTNLGKRIVSKLTRKWKKEHAWLPQDETTYFGYASGKIFATESAQAASYGIHASTFEIGQQFFLEPNSSIHSSVVFTLGTEAFVNWLILNLKHNTDFYNNYKR